MFAIASVTLAQSRGRVATSQPLSPPAPETQAVGAFSTFCNGIFGATAACPCSNVGDPAAGCDIAQGTGGVILDVQFLKTVPSNGATLTSTGYPQPSTPATLIVRSPSLLAVPVVDGDGIRCLSTTSLVRLASTLAVGGSASHPIPHGAMAGSGTFHYQAWFRNLPASFCTPEEYNYSSGISIDW